MNERILSNRYKLLEKIGHGGMSTVYKAEDLALKRTVAIKVMHSELSQTDEFIQRFSWEARATSRLSHRNIVGMYDAGNDQQTYYLVMEYVAGTTLKEQIKQKGSLPIHESISIMMQLCDALAHAHQNGIIHRDIKPQNIMCKENHNQYKIMDFGISRFSSNDVNLTKTGSVMGSVHYFSPEQAQGQNIDITSDLYSLGVVLYEMLTGHPPYDATEEIAVALKHIQEAVPDPKAINPTIPDTLSHIVMKAMAKKPADRFSSAEEMKEQLESIHTSSITYVSHQSTETSLHQIQQHRSEKNAVKPKMVQKMIWSLTSIVAIALLTFFGYRYVEASFLEKDSSTNNVQDEVPKVQPVAKTETSEQEVNRNAMETKPDEQKEPEKQQKSKEKKHETAPKQFQTKYLVSIGSFAEKENAYALENKLKQQGIHVKIMESKVFSKTMFRVHAGIFTTLEEAEQHLQNVKSSGIEETANALVVPIAQKK